MLEKWVETQRLVSAEKSRWRVGRELLVDRLDLLRREAAALREKTAQSRGDVGSADARLAELTARAEELKATTAGLDVLVAECETRLRALLTRAPEPFRERVKPLSVRLPADPAQPGITLSERFQNVIGILNEMNKFNQELTDAVEVRALPDGQTAEVSVLYLGLGGAYYANPGSGLGGYGVPGPQGWDWIRADELAGPVAEAAAVFRNERPAAYVGLPAAVK
jgi:hypothetical protein